MLVFHQVVYAKTRFSLVALLAVAAVFAAVLGFTVRGDFRFDPQKAWSFVLFTIGLSVALWMLLRDRFSRIPF